MSSEVTERRAAMRERIKQLAGEFLRRCSRDVMSMRGLLRRLGTGDAGVCKELEHLAHRICGTGASLGFEVLSTRAAAIERLAEGRSDIAATDQILMVRLVEYVAALEIEVDRLIHASV
jgi:HPt (histidine-containing phosphotransfer) domain-containing protein